MQILNFRVKNHKSLRDETALELLDSSLTTLKPSANKTWGQYVHTVAGIFGANASGKSNVLDALRYFTAAIENSSTIWQDSSSFPHVPFKLSDTSRTADSAYELDFLLDDIRYRYGFSVNSEGVNIEYLMHLPKSRWRTIFTREYVEGIDSVDFIARDVKKLEVSHRELVLSRAATLGRKDILGSVAHAITHKIDFVLLSERDQQMRIEAIIKALVELSITRDDIAQLLQVADIGIQKVDIWQSEDNLDVDNLPQDMPRTVQQMILQILATEQNSAADSNAKLIQRRLEFFHNSADSNSPPLYLSDESDGTLAWLAISFAVLEALRTGKVVCGDELDSSLHPHLVRLIISLFTDPSVNTRGAQLIFTTHDATILHHYEELGLSTESIWFTEKDRDGSTELFSLSDFPKITGANIEKRYLSGRYGAVPFVAHSIFWKILEDKNQKLAQIEDMNHGS